MNEKKKIEIKRKQEEEKLAKFRGIEEQQGVLWDKIDELIKEKKTKSYDEAVKILKNLKDLSLHKKSFNNFVKKVEQIKNNYKNLSGLKWRIKEAKLVEL